MSASLINIFQFLIKIKKKNSEESFAAMVTGEKRRLSNKVEKITEYLIIWTFQNHWIFEHTFQSPHQDLYDHDGDEEAITMIGMMINWSCAQEVTVVLKKGFKNTVSSCFVHLYFISNQNSFLILHFSKQSAQIISFFLKSHKVIALSNMPFSISNSLFTTDLIEL